MAEDQQNTNIPSINTAFRPEMAFPNLTDEMIARLQAYGHQETFPPETALWSRGEREVCRAANWHTQGTRSRSAPIDEQGKQSLLAND